MTLCLSAPDREQLRVGKPEEFGAGKPEELRAGKLE